MTTATAAVDERERGFLAKTMLLVRKDMMVESRGRETLPTMLAFGFAVTLMLAFTLPAGVALSRDVTIGPGVVPVAQVLAGFFWVTVLFAGLIGFARGFEIERVDGALDPLLLAPLDRSGLFGAKAATNLLMLLLVQVLLTPVFALLFAVNLGNRWIVFSLVMILVDFGFVAVGTLFAALAAQTRARELMLPILALPVLVPLFIAATELTGDLLLGASLGSVAARGWFGIVVAFDVVFAVIGAIAFEFAVER